MLLFTSVLMTSCYSLGLLTVQQSQKDTIEDINNYIKRNKYRPDFSFQITDEGYHRVGYGVDKLERNQSVGSQIQLRIFKSNGRLLTGYSLCLNHFREKQFLGNNYPPTVNTAGEINYNLSFNQEIDIWNLTPSQELEVIEKTNRSDLNFVVYWNSSAGFYSSRVINEVRRYKGEYPDAQIALILVNVSSDTKGIQEPYINEVVDTLTENSTAESLLRTSEYLMMHGYYAKAAEVISRSSLFDIQCVQASRFLINKGVSQYHIGEFDGAIATLSEIALNDNSPNTTAIVYIGKSIEKQAGYTSALEYYESVQMDARLYGVHILPRIDLCNYHLHKDKSSVAKLKKHLYNYPYASEMPFVLGDYYRELDPGKACKYFTEGAQFYERYKEYSILCEMKLEEYCVH